MFARIPNRVENDIDDMRYHNPPQSHDNTDSVHTESQEHGEDQTKLKRQKGSRSKKDSVEAEAGHDVEDDTGKKTARGRKPGKKEHVGEGISAE